MKALLTRKKKNDKGFSLIELIIAIAILVILTGLLAPNILRYVEKSREAKDMQTLDTVYEAVQIALTEEGLTVDSSYANGKPLDNDLSTSADDLQKEMSKTLGSQKLTLVSKNCKASGVKIFVKVGTDNAVEVWAGTDVSNVVGNDSHVKFKVPTEAPTTTNP